MAQRRLRTARGFTLIELVIAIAILAIIVGIAIPAYTAQVTKTNRTEGKSELMQTAQVLERCYTRYSSYNHANCNVSFPFDSENGHYQITASRHTATAFTIEAAPQGTQDTRDKWCGTFTLTHTGQKDMTGDADWDATRCWN